MKNLLIALAFFFPLAPAPLAWTVALSGGDAARTDAQKIQGKWLLVYAECGGTDVTRNLMGYWQSVTFEARTLTRANGGFYHADPRENFLKDSYELNTGTNPRGIAIKEFGGTSNGWYAVDEDRLLLRLPFDYTTRKTAQGTKTLLVLRRSPS